MLLSMVDYTLLKVNRVLASEIMSHHVELVEKTMRVLEALSQAEGDGTLRSIARKAGLGKSSTFRILSTLKELSYVDQPAANGAYRLTPRILGLARTAVTSASLTGIAQPHLIRLRDRVGESAWLAQLRHGEVILINVVEAPHPLHLRYAIGDRCPMHATALGKAIAASLDPDDLRRILGQEDLPSFTSRTLTSLASLGPELMRVRSQGFAMNNEETVEGVIMWGTPVTDARGKVFAAVSVGVPMARCSEEHRQQAIIDSLKTAGTAISADLASVGYAAPDAELMIPDNGLDGIPLADRMG